MPDNPSVTAVVLSYNRPQYLRESLQALARQTRPASRIVVVDNRSPASEEVAETVAEFAGVEFICNPDNLGFTGGMNVGIAAATGEYVLLIEDDITADADCLAELVRCMEADPRIGLCGATMFNRGDGSIRCAGGELSLGARYGKRILTCERSAAPYPVSYLPGALLLARRDDLRRWGGFRDDFFMYYEDDELCLRVLKECRTIVVAPRAKVSHFDPPPGSPRRGWTTSRSAISSGSTCSTRGRRCCRDSSPATRRGSFSARRSGFGRAACSSWPPPLTRSSGRRGCCGTASGSWTRRR